MYDLNKSEARQVQLHLKHTGGWNKLAEAFPKFAAAVDLLPDESGLPGNSIILREILGDAVCRVRGLQYGTYD